jgi:hypothetical protein
MTFTIISGVMLPPKKRSGPKKGTLRYDNRQIVHEAAIKVIAKRCNHATDAATLLKDRYISRGTDQSKIAMFVKKINATIKMDKDP